jgi:hypothetical protein
MSANTATKWVISRSLLRTALMVSQLGYSSPFLRRLEISPCQWPSAVSWCHMAA